jgi:hypothetical protein
MENTKIIIEVQGGNVQAVYANSNDIEIDVLDYDNLNGASKPEIAETKRLEKKVSTLKQIY